MVHGGEKYRTTDLSLNESESKRQNRRVKHCAEYNEVNQQESVQRRGRCEKSWHC